MDSFYHGGDTQTIFNLIGESLFKIFYWSYSEKCPSEHNAMCPSEHNTQTVSFEHDAMCPSEHEAGISWNWKKTAVLT